MNAAQTEITQPLIDSVEVKLARETMTIRQAAIRVLGRMLNFIEEDRLTNIARMIQDRRLQTTDLESAFSSWATSSGAKSFRYFLAIIERKTTTRKVEESGKRPPPRSQTPNGKPFENAADANAFIVYLIDNSIDWGEQKRDGVYYVYAPNVESLYQTYLRSSNG